MAKNSLKKFIAGAMAAVLTVAGVVSGQFATDAKAATKYVLNPSEMTAQTFSANATAGTDNYFTIEANTDNTVVIDGNSKSATIGGVAMDFTQRLKMGGTAKADYRNVTFTTSGAATITVACMSSSSSADRTLGLYDADFNQIGAADAPATLAVSTIEVTAAGTYSLGSTKSGVNIYYIEVSEGGSSSAPSGDTVDVADMMVQYKAEPDGQYTLRTVYKVAAADIANYDSVGVKISKDNSSEYSFGTSVFASVTANGSAVEAGAGYYFVVNEITNVPADANFTVEAYAVVGGVQTALTASGAINMSTIIQ